MDCTRALVSNCPRFWLPSLLIVREWLAKNILYRLTFRARTIAGYRVPEHKPSFRLLNPSGYQHLFRLPLIKYYLSCGALQGAVILLGAVQGAPPKKN